MRRLLSLVVGVGLSAGLLAATPTWAAPASDASRAAAETRGYLEDDDYFVLYEESDDPYDCAGVYCEITDLLVGVRKDYPDEIMLEATMDRDTDPLLSTDADANVVAFIVPEALNGSYYVTQIPFEYMGIGKAYFTDVERYDPSADQWTDTGVDAEWYRGSTYWKVWVPWRALNIDDAGFSMRVRDGNGNADDAPDDVTPSIPIRESVDDATDPGPDPTPDLPGTPTDVQANLTGDRDVAVSFLPPTSGASVTGYEVQTQRDGGAWESVTSSSSRSDALVGPDVVNGRNPTNDEFDVLASLRMTTVDGTGYVCGGSFVSPTKVITAAHCLYDGDGVQVASVTAGPQEDAYKPTSSVMASRIDIHPGYSPTGRDESNDIAVLTLRSPISGVPTIALPSATQAADATQGGDRVKSAGWGRTSSGGSTPQTFRVADLTVIPDEVCSSSSGTYRVGSLVYEGIGVSVKPQTMLCAGGVTSSGLAIDTCQGDSGGPLVAGSGEGAVLVGVVSWGIGCAGYDDKGQLPWLTPGVYTRLATYLPWLATKGVEGVDGVPVDRVTRTVRGLSPGRYAFRVRAVGVDGPGGWSSGSDPVRVDETAVPSKPEYLDVAYRIKGRKAVATVYWTWSSFDSGPPVSYRYRVRKAGKRWSSWKPVASQVPEAKGVKISGLKVGAKHRMQIQAVNPLGESPSLTITLRPTK